MARCKTEVCIHLRELIGRLSASMLPRAYRLYGLVITTIRLRLFGNSVFLAIKGDGMNDQPSEPALPILPSNYESIRGTNFYVIIDGKIATGEESERLLETMYNHEEARFYLYFQKNSGVSTFMLSAERASCIKFEITEMSYFPPPNFQRDFIKLNKEDPVWPWQDEVFENSPGYMRTILKLTQKTKRRLDRKDLVAELKDENPFLLQPNFFSVGVDLNKAWSGLKGKFAGLGRLEPLAKQILERENALAPPQ